MQLYQKGGKYDLAYTPKPSPGSALIKALEWGIGIGAVLSVWAALIQAQPNPGILTYLGSLTVYGIYKDGAFNAGPLYDSASSENYLELQGTRSLVLGGKPPPQRSPLELTPAHSYKNLKEPMVKEETLIIPASKECPVPEQVSSLEAFPPPQSAQSGGDDRAAQELQLLAELIGCKPAPPGDAFTLQLFSPETESAEVAEGNKDPEESIFTIDASKGARLTNYENILQDLTLEPSSQPQDDLLELMDKA